MPRAGDNKPRRYRRERHTHTTPRRQLRSFAQGTPSFLPGGRKRQRALTQSHSTNETDTRPIYSHYRSPLAPYDLVVVLPLPRMGGSCACGEGGSRAASACGAAGTLPCSAASCLARLTACLRTRSRCPCAACVCVRSARVASFTICLAKTMREIGDV